MKSHKDSHDVFLCVCEPFIGIWRKGLPNQTVNTSHLRKPNGYTPGL